MHRAGVLAYCIRKSGLQWLYMNEEARYERFSLVCGGSGDTELHTLPCSTRKRSGPLWKASANEKTGRYQHKDLAENSFASLHVAALLPLPLWRQLKSVARGISLMATLVTWQERERAGESWLPDVCIRADAISL